MGAQETMGSSEKRENSTGTIPCCSYNAADNRSKDVLNIKMVNTLMKRFVVDSRP